MGQRNATIHLWRSLSIGPYLSVEVERASSRLNNNRAAGPDNIPGNCLSTLHNPSMNMLHSYTTWWLCLETVLALERASWYPLQKPGKPKGPTTSLQPIVLLTALRKVLSLTVLARVQGKVDLYVSANQSGFRPNRSTSHVVWSHKWLAARCQRYQQQIHILGVDLSKAFDTVCRRKLLEVLRTLLPSDEVRLIHLLLSNTSLRTKIKDNNGDSFPTTSGTPTGWLTFPCIVYCLPGGSLKRCH